MKDIFFDDYKKGSKRDSKYDTEKIPLSEIERERQERINRQRYEQAMRSQQREFERRMNEEGHSPQQEKARREATPNLMVKKTTRRHYGCGCSTLFISLLLIIALIFGGGFGYIFAMSCKTDYVKSEHRSSYGIKSDPNVYNVLLIGTDKESDGAARSDTMMLVSVDKNGKMLKFTSLMRDMWVSIPGYDDAKLNAAFAYGGAELLMRTIEMNFKVKIDNYITVDFEMFKALIDGLGGVDVDITAEEAQFINNTTHATVEEGINHLDGDYALIYCRIRKLDSDFKRTERQRKVMTAILNKMLKQNPFVTLSAAGDVLPLIKTDISPLKLTLKAVSAVSFISYGNDQMRLPADGEFYDDTINGQAALVLDFEENTRLLQEFIYG